MTIKQAKRKGYRIMWASSFEVGLVKNNRGIRTWWARDFDGKLPTLSHPAVQLAIQITEDMEKELGLR